MSHANSAGPAALNHKLIMLYKNQTNERFIGPLPETQGSRHFVQVFSKPVDSFDPARRDLMLGGVPAASLNPVNFTTLQRLTTVIAQAAFGNGSSTEDLFRDITVGGQRHAGVMTIRQFMALDAGKQMSVIDTAWDRVCTKKAYNKVASAMFDPLRSTVAPTGAPLPSGLVPDGSGGYRAGYRGETGLPNAFSTLGVGFRVDGSGDNCERDITRVLSQGMTTQLKNRWLMREIKGWEVEGTIVDRDTSAPRVWATKNDLFNESAVCVARNLFGATAFPLREFEGEAVLWAVSVSGLVGFDTETYQTTLGADRQWRPGEKAFMRIPPGNVIGHVRFRKTGTPGAQGGWKFQIPGDAEWKMTPGWASPKTGRHGDSQIRAYLKSQLEAWRGPEHTISGAFDFAT